MTADEWNSHNSQKSLELRKLKKSKIFHFFKIFTNKIVQVALRDYSICGWKTGVCAFGTDFFWADDAIITGVGAERAKVLQIDIGSTHYTMRIADIQCCVQSGGCEFRVAPSMVEWALLEKYLRLSLTAAAKRKGSGNCGITTRQTSTTQRVIVKNITVHIDSKMEN
jgi:hypothetical protein